MNGMMKKNLIEDELYRNHLPITKQYGVVQLFTAKLRRRT